MIATATRRKNPRLSSPLKLPPDLVSATLPEETLGAVDEVDEVDQEVALVPVFTIIYYIFVYVEDSKATRDSIRVNSDNWQFPETKNPAPRRLVAITVMMGDLTIEVEDVVIVEAEVAAVVEEMTDIVEPE